MCDLCEPVATAATPWPIQPEIDLTICSMFDLVLLHQFFDTLGEAALSCLNKPRFSGGPVADFADAMFHNFILMWKHVVWEEINRRTPTNKTDAGHRAEVLIRDYALDGDWSAIARLAGEMVEKG